MNQVHLNQWWLQIQRLELTRQDPRLLGYQKQFDWFWCVQGKRRDLWYLDSGCSRHMTGDHSLLTGFEKKAGPGVTFGDDNKRYTLGYGKIKKENVIIEKVALVDGLKHNMLSISQLCDNGNKVHFSQEDCFIVNNETENILLTGNIKGNVYIVDFNSSKVDSLTRLLSKASVDDNCIWHKKLSHLNFKAMNLLMQKNLVRGLPNKEFTKDGLYDSCQKGKQRKASFKRKSIN